MTFLLLIYFQFKHFFADYPLQTPWMLKKFSKDWSFVGPLSAHCGVHAMFTALAVIFSGRLDCWYLPLVDFVAHFVMDRIKASPNLLGRFEALSKKEMKGILSYVPTLGSDGVKNRFGEQLSSNRWFWYSLGIDQMVHHLTDLFIVWILVS